MANIFNPAGNWFVHVFEEIDALTNCIKALAAYRKEVGEYWPARIIVNRYNRLRIGWGEGITVRRGAPEDHWIITNAVYMSTDDKLHDPPYQRKATVLSGKRQPVEDVYQTYYRMRMSPVYVLSLPEKGIENE